MRAADSISPWSEVCCVEREEGMSLRLLKFIGGGSIDDHAICRSSCDAETELAVSRTERGDDCC
jgi:hypothetical protein